MSSNRKVQYRRPAVPGRKPFGISQIGAPLENHGLPCEPSPIFGHSAPRQVSRNSAQKASLFTRFDRWQNYYVPCNQCPIHHDRSPNPVVQNDPNPIFGHFSLCVARRLSPALYIPSAQPHAILSFSYHLAVL